MKLTYDQYRERFSGDIYYYGNASHGFYDVMKWLQKTRPKQKPNIVMPVYIPAKLYRFVLAAGYRPVFYDVDLNCGFEPDNVAGLIDDQTQAVFIVHYFGSPAPVQELKKLIGESGVYLIEDCVHTLHTRIAGIELGTIGDCAIFSTRKMLQLPSGGFLAMNGPANERISFTPLYSKKVRSLYSGFYLAASRLKYGYYRVTQGLDPLKLAWVPGTGYIDFAEEQYVNPKEMSRLTKQYLKSINLEKVIQKRRFNYNYLLRGIEKLNFIKPVYPEKFHTEIKTPNGSLSYLKGGITPYSFPILTPPGTREMLRRLLCDAGVGCGAGWPETPFHHVQFRNTKILSERLLELPVHQGINKHQLDRMITCLNRYEFKYHPSIHVNGFQPKLSVTT